MKLVLTWEKFRASIRAIMTEDEQKNPMQMSESSSASGDPQDDVVISASDFSVFHPADAADQLENLTLKEQVLLVQDIPIEEAALMLEEMDEHNRVPLFEVMDAELAADLLEQMSPDDAADALDELSEAHRAHILGKVEHQEAAEICDLMSYDSDTAGGVMNTECLVLDPGLSVDQAISIVRQEIGDKELPYYVYLVDEGERLVGVPSLREILMSRPGTMLKDLIGDKELISVVFDVDKEQVANQLMHYNFLALPVVDYEGKFLGVVTHDDVMDILQEEASEDMLGMVGAGQDETVDTPWKSSVIKRLPWLLINVGNSAIASYIVHLFEGTIAQMAILAALMHIVSNQAGNTGQQSLAVIIRQMAVEQFENKRALFALLRELKVGAANGVLIGVMVFIAVYLFTQNLPLAEVMGISLGVNMLVGALAGASIPLILKKLGRDPAQASSIFLTTLTDSSGFFIFLGLAVIMLF